MTASITNSNQTSTEDDALLTPNAGTKTASRRMAGRAVRLSSSMTTYSAAPVAQAAARVHTMLQADKSQTASKACASVRGAIGSTEPDFSPVPETVVTVPKGMSRVDTLQGLWNCCPPSYYTFDNEFMFRRRDARVFENRDALDTAIQNDPQVEDFAGRNIRVDFSEFPKIDLERFQRSCKPHMSIDQISQRCLKK